MASTGLPNQEQAATRIDEVVDGIYRISTWTPDYGITLNQFLIDDDRPALIHTGEHWRYEAVRNAITEVLDPARLEFVALLHFESDECGGIERFVAAAPDSTLVCSALSAGLNLSGWDYPGKVQGFTDGEVLDLGKHKLRPGDTARAPLGLDDGVRRDDPQPVPRGPVSAARRSAAGRLRDLGAEMCGVYRAAGIFAHEDPVRAVVDRIDALQPSWMHAMHGGSLTADAIPACTRALQEQRFGYEGKLLGREVLPEVQVAGVGMPPTVAAS